MITDSFAEVLGKVLSSLQGAELLINNDKKIIKGVVRLCSKNSLDEEYILIRRGAKKEDDHFEVLKWVKR